MFLELPLRVSTSKLATPILAAPRISILTCSLGVHHALGDPLAVEVGHLVEEGDILQEEGSALSDTYRGRLLSDRQAVGRGEDRAVLLQESGGNGSGW